MGNKKIGLAFKIKKPVLALGGQAKNTVCFIRGKVALVSRVRADLNNPEDLRGFARDAENFLRKRPEIIAYDLHPEYSSAKYILDLSPRRRVAASPIQHHHAHIAACMAENGLANKKVIGVAFDGTGLGSDGNLWGAEFLVCDYKNFKRRAHLREIPLVGGEKAISEPWRLLAAWLGFPRAVDKEGVLKKIYLAGVNSPLASSMGRLFDCVGSLVLGKRKADFEAELAIRLEGKASGYQSKGRSYRFDCDKIKGVYILNPQKAIRKIALDLRAGEPKEKIAYNFHLTVAEMVRRACAALKKDTGINTVALSGGVFQNKLLLRLSLDLLYREGFRVLTHRKLSCSDASLSLGQAVIAGFSEK